MMSFFSNRIFLAGKRLAKHIWPSCQMILFFTDCVTLFFAFALAVFLRELLGGSVNFLVHIQLSMFLLIAPLLNIFHGLNSPTPPVLPEELRCLALSSSLAFLGIGFFYLLSRPVEQPSRLTLLMGWTLCLLLVPLARNIVRKRFAKKAWWGRPTVVFGFDDSVVQLIKLMQNNPLLGLKPVALAAEGDITNNTLDDIRVLDDHEVMDFLYAQHNACALVVLPRADDRYRFGLHMRTIMQSFPHVILVPQEFLDSSIPCWLRPMEFGQTLALELRQNLLDPKRILLKRSIDFVSSFFGMIFLSPFLAVIALAIMIESPGSPFFRHKRIGFGGTALRVLKFRTMVQNAESVLNEYLEKNPELKEEWEKDQKLRHDPRVTRVGAFLRKTSLDELPQLWNVFCGEMSLVGPRPIVNNEIVKYGETFNTYVRVRPGITGLWQVSGRNDISYEERVTLDRYYVSNWSTWLDIFILAKTIPVLCARKGAY